MEAYIKLIIVIASTFIIFILFVLYNRYMKRRDIKSEYRGYNIKRKITNGRTIITSPEGKVLKVFITCGFQETHRYIDDFIKKGET